MVEIINTSKIREVAKLFFYNFRTGSGTMHIMHCSWRWLELWGVRWVPV